MKIVVDQNICIGAAPCVAIASRTFELDEKGKAFVKNQKGDPFELIKQAAESCPVQAISIFDNEGNQIYP
jgi:ferredoxin